jgi:hypothetical protein
MLIAMRIKIIVTDAEVRGAPFDRYRAVLGNLSGEGQRRRCRNPARRDPGGHGGRPGNTSADRRALAVANDITGPESKDGTSVKARPVETR